MTNFVPIFSYSFVMVKDCRFSGNYIGKQEGKRHTARRVAIAISCYSGGGGPSTKNFFSSLNMYQAKSGVKNFSLY